jgi:hypothetical protein
MQAGIARRVGSPGIAWLLACLLLTACAHAPSQDIAVQVVDAGIVTSVAFTRDGRLLRVRSSDRSVLVDYSDDQGRHYSTPVAVNSEAQRIISRSGDRPAMAIDENGQVAIIYYAATRHGVSPYLAVSVDRGAHFDKARSLAAPSRMIERSMVQLATDARSTAHLLWYESGEQHHGATLYHGSNTSLTALQAPQQSSANALCECCRPAVTFNRHGEPVFFGRMMFQDGSRDHVLLNLETGKLQRTTADFWRINACPMHGPALAIDRHDTYHVAWFTRGEARQGLFYAYSTDQGGHFSEPGMIGNPARTPRHAALLAADDRVFLAWEEYDEGKTYLMIMESTDAGNHWSEPVSIASSAGLSDYPTLVSNGLQSFVSWNSRDTGHLLMSLPRPDGMGTHASLPDH